jgi:hypothetical protein
VNSPYMELAHRVRDEVPDLERVIKRVLRSWELSKGSPEQQDVYLDSVALNLHGFYSGLERLFELIARHVDRDLPAGETWHCSLLQQMTKDVEDVRPAVISVENARILDGLRRFRHLVRNVYTLNLVPEKIEPLVAALPGLWLQLKAELLAFADFLEDLAQAGEV